MTAKRARMAGESAKATIGAGGILDRIGEVSSTTDLRGVSLGEVQPNPVQPRQHFDQEGKEYP